jgi:hypothetical protein
MCYTENKQNTTDSQKQTESYPLRVKKRKDSEYIQALQWGLRVCFKTKQLYKYTVTFVVYLQALSEEQTI